MQRLQRYLWPAAKAVIFLVALRVILSELHQFRYRELVSYLHALTPLQLLLALAATAASYLTLSTYDVLGMRHGSHAVPLRRTMFGSFVSYAVSNTMSTLVGGSLRYRLYTAWGLSPAEAARVMAFGMGTFWLGFLTLAGAVLTLHPVIAASPAIGPVLLLVPAVYTAMVATRVRRMPSASIAGAQLVVSSADWLFAAIAFHALLPSALRISFMATLAAFLAAQLLGVISSLPGGAGVFEATVIALLGPRANASHVAGALLVYRAIYYLLPLLVAGLLVATQEIVRRRRELTRIGRGVLRTASLFVPSLFSAALFIAGMVLLISGATPAEQQRLHALRTAIPLPVLELAHLVGSMCGAGLLLLARGVQRRLNGAYVLSASLLAIGIAASLLKGLDYEEAILLALILGPLLPCRAHFYRKTALIDEPFTPAWVTTIALTVVSTVWLGLFAYRRIEYSPELWWHFSFAGDAPRFLRATLAVAAVALAFSLRKLMHPVPLVSIRVSAEDVERAAAIANAHPSPCGFLALLGDKSILFDGQKSAFVMYAVQGRSWIAMGDPAGPQAAARALSWTFFEQADRHNGWPVFYQVRRTHLPLYIELGLHLLKLGEEARVDVPSFSLEGGGKKSLRRTLRSLEAGGATFEVVMPDAKTIAEARVVSDEWLSAKRTREKRFSVGRFDEAYLQRLPLAVVRSGGELVAFANLWGDAAKEELTVDLMRHSLAAPPGVMDFLFVHLILHARTECYRWFNLGLAPLSGLEARAQGPLWPRIAALGVEHGARFYNFQGLRQYKEKFDPVWEPVYLASPGGMRLARVLTDIAALTSGSVRGIVMK